MKCLTCQMVIEFLSSYKPRLPGIELKFWLRKPNRFVLFKFQFSYVVIIWATAITIFKPRMGGITSLTFHRAFYPLKQFE